MPGSFRIGRLLGIQFSIAWSWLFVFMLVTWNLTAVFTHVHADWGPALSFFVALVAALLFFASIVVHELAHSLVARTQGIRVRGITLFLFGGISNFEQEPQSPKAELLITVVGPLTSTLLGAIFIGLASIGTTGIDLTGAPSDVVARLDPATTLLLWLGPMNIFLGLFNCIPAFPLDGGRVLRAIMWAAMRDLRKATHAASIVGQAIGWIFIAIGLAMSFGIWVPFFGTGFIGGLWLAFIGWFLHGAAAASYRGILVRDALQGVPAERIMRTHVPFVDANASVSALVHVLIDREERMLPVVRDGDLLGFVRLEDVRKVPRDRRDDTAVSAIATPLRDWVTFDAKRDLADAFEALARRGWDQAPVMENGKVVGMLRLQDIARWLEMQPDVSTWRPRISHG